MPDTPLSPSATTHPGRLFVVSAPSGAGKTTLCSAVRKRFPSLQYSVSSTTRAPRPGERDGEDYHFISKAVFEEKIHSGGWAEWAEVHGNFYGTSAAVLEAAIGRGRHVLMDIDVQGAEQILARYPESVTIFIMPPSHEVLVQRLAGRGTDDPAQVKRRLAAAEREMSQRGRYRHILVNDDFDAAAAELADLFSRYMKSVPETANAAQGSSA